MVALGDVGVSSVGVWVQVKCATLGGVPALGDVPALGSALALRGALVLGSPCVGWRAFASRAPPWLEFRLSGFMSELGGRMDVFCHAATANGASPPRAPGWPLGRFLSDCYT